MPISADRFESIDEDDDGPTPGTNAHEILAFLESNPERAFTQTEVVEATGVARGSVGPTLVRLREAGRVDHRGTYWRVSDREGSPDAALGRGDATTGESEPSDDVAWWERRVDPRDGRG